MVRHDMHLAKQAVKSEVIRHSHGWLTPEERQKEAEAQEKRRKEERRLEALGMSLFQEGEA